MSFPILIRKRVGYAPFAFCVDCGEVLSHVPKHCKECKKYHEQEIDFGSSEERKARLLMLSAKAIYFARRAWNRNNFDRHGHLMKKYHKFWMLAADAIMAREKA